MLRGDLYKPWFANENDWGFEILTGEFQGVVVQIESVKFDEKNEGSVDLSFHTIHKPELITDENIKGDLFNSVVEIVINDILKEALNHYESEKTNEQNRDNNT